MRTLAFVVAILAATAGLAGCKKERAPRRHELGALAPKEPPGTLPPSLVSLRVETLRRARELAGPVADLTAAIDARDLARARTALLEARRRERDLEPITHGSARVATSQLGAWENDIEREEASRFAGFRGAYAALTTVPPSWDDAKKSGALLRSATALLPQELELAAFTLTDVAQSVSDGAFALGARADGSDWPDLSTRTADLRAEIGGLLRAAGAVRDAVRAREPGWADPLDAVLEELHAYLRALGDEPHDLLDLLAISARVGAEVRLAARRLGASRVAPPFPAHRPLPDADLTPVSIATFPRLARVAADPRIALLGADLFRSPVLSRTGEIGCASCHDPARDFSRETPRLTFDHRVPPRNAPGLWNVGYEVAYFWDGRATTLDAQIDIAVERDMGGRWDEITRRVSADPDLAAQFLEVLGSPASPASIHRAIVAFEQSLIRDDTPMDAYVRGDRSALTAPEKAGFDLYFGKARCSRCHRLPLTSGMVAPRFLRSDMSAIGVTTKPGSHVIDPDLGRAAITHRDLDRGLFKVPGLRGLTRTAPYFHNGAFATLEDVVDFYVKGGGPGLGLAVPNADPDLAPTPLEPGERAQLLEFLRTGLRQP